MKMHTLFLSAVTALALWPALLQAQSAPSCSRIFSESTGAVLDPAQLKQVTDVSQVEDRLWAVHATDYMAKNNTLELHYSKSFFSPTTHFAIGELVAPHENGSWENKKYAVILPLKSLYPQMLNFMALDTFVLGGVRLPKTAVWVVPQGTAVPANVQKFEFDPSQTTLRVAIENAIESRGGLVMRTQGGFGGESSTPVVFKQVMENAKAAEKYTLPSVNKADFFSSLIRRLPGRSFGAHNRSVVGHAGRFGEIHFWAQELNMGLTDPTRNAILLATSKVNLARLDSFISRVDFPAEAKASYSEYRNQVLELVKTATDAQKALSASTPVDVKTVIDQLSDTTLGIYMSTLQRADMDLFLNEFKTLQPEYLNKMGGDHTLKLMWAMGRHSVLSSGGEMGKFFIQQERLQEVIATEYNILRDWLDKAEVKDREDAIFRLNISVQNYNFIKRRK